MATIAARAAMALLMKESDINRRLKHSIWNAIERCPRILTPGGGHAWPDKKLVEVDVVRELATMLREAARRSITDIKPRLETKPPTPPDVLARNEHGGLIGIEVGELTHQAAIEQNVLPAKALHAALRQARTSAERVDALVRHPCKVWTPSGREALDAAEILAAEKDAKPFGGDSEPYAERWLVVHTGEPHVHVEEVQAAWSTATSLAPQQFDFIYLLHRNRLPALDSGATTAGWIALWPPTAPA